MSSFYFSREHYEDINQLPCLPKRNILTINRKGRISKLGIIFPVTNVGFFFFKKLATLSLNAHFHANQGKSHHDQDFRK